MGSVGDALLQEQAGLVEPRDKETVHHKAGTVSANDHHFPEHLAVLDDLVNGFLTGGLGGNDLDQTVLGWVVKEVQTNEPIGATGCLCESVHGKRRGVGGEDGAVAARFVQRVEDSGFDIEIFEHGFDDQIGVLCCVLDTHDTRDSMLN